MNDRINCDFCYVCCGFVAIVSLLLNAFVFLDMVLPAYIVPQGGNHRWGVNKQLINNFNITQIDFILEQFTKCTKYIKL